MNILPEKREQIRQMHAGLIHRVVMACRNPQLVPDLPDLLKSSEQNGWTTLVAAIRRVLKGERDQRLLHTLDEEDHVIVESILLGLQNPHTLPDLDFKPDAGMAAPGFASLVHAARRGNDEALQLIANMAEQMLGAGGDMTRLAGIVRPLVMGERDPDRLCKGLGDDGQKLVLAILKELAQLEAH
jgi:hypothetical protein